MTKMIKGTNHTSDQILIKIPNVQVYTCKEGIEWLKSKYQKTRQNMRIVGC